MTLLKYFFVLSAMVVLVNAAYGAESADDQANTTEQAPVSDNESAHDDSEDPPVVFVESSDEKMNQAMQKARDTFPQFVANWQQKNINYSLKFGLKTHDGELHHIWFNPTEMKDGTITAVCANNPRSIPGLSLGDERVLDIAQLSDWLILTADAKCYGGYTIRVLAELDESLDLPYEFVEFPTEDEEADLGSDKDN